VFRKRWKAGNRNLLDLGDQILGVFCQQCGYQAAYKARKFADTLGWDCKLNEIDGQLVCPQCAANSGRPEAKLRIQSNPDQQQLDQNA